MDFETMEYLDRKQRNFEKGLDKYITGNYGEDQNIEGED